ncbi:MAG: hypothetical protein LBN27_14045 [Prevotellaceae bacterium]|jgi:hypothetical protein|nr:hypothetical protein [Prevotellaceae bacterium]
MTTAAKRVQEKISWGLPSQTETSLEDFRTMIAEAERGTGYTFDEYTNKVNQWLRNNL